jgi:hypothetical protein
VTELYLELFLSGFQLGREIGENMQASIVFGIICCLLKVMMQQIEVNHPQKDIKI